MNHSSNDPSSQDSSAAHPNSDEPANDWSLDASSLDASGPQADPTRPLEPPSRPADSGNPGPLNELSQVMVVGRDNHWALVFAPLTRDLIWVDLGRTPFETQEYNPVQEASDAAATFDLYGTEEPSFEQGDYDPDGDAPFPGEGPGDGWDNNDCWPL